MAHAHIAQVALCTSSIPETTRLLSRSLGFASASGGRPMWGERIATIQDLPTGDATALTLWWMVGRQDFMQLELFTHSVPPQRPREATWRPSDLGWTRFGVMVPDFDRALAQLTAAGVTPFTAPVADGVRRRICFVEPTTQVPVEVIEASVNDLASDRRSFYSLEPAVHYVSASVADIGLARDIFHAAGLKDAAPDAVHSPEHEEVWGLSDARREVHVLTDGDVYLELAQYQRPRPAARSAERRLSDQGFMNIGIGFRQLDDLHEAYDAMASLGCKSRTALPTLAGGTYLETPIGLSIETLVAPRELDSEYGFVPMPRFPRPLIWPGGEQSPTTG